MSRRKSLKPSRDEWRLLRRLARKLGTGDATRPEYKSMLRDIKRVHGLESQGMAIHLAHMRLVKGGE